MNHAIAGRRYLVLLLLIFIPLISQSKTMEIENGMSLEKARKLLIKDKWRPVNVHVRDQYEYFGVEKELVERKIYEVEGCAMDKPLCIFHYKKADKCLRVITYGEQIKDMKIDHWTNACPD
ncbi:hypothetical protein [Undibacterium sp.]|uniref:hypothetical protein n=1 Tax=Undibacterium sp. TaxID=1914977 RepID=UPI0025E74C16|nr:hypothetical protein [Undibacterium sp.]